LSGNANKWKKNSPLLLFNPGNRRGTDAFGSPSTATYENGKITLSYTLDSTSVHLNDGVTQAITVSNIPSYVPTNGLVGYWPFNGNAKDESGNGNNGAISDVSFSKDRFSKIAAAKFNGSTSQMVVQKNSNLLTANYSISIWFKPSNSLSYSCILRSGDAQNCSWQGFAITDFEHNTLFGFSDFGNSDFAHKTRQSIDSYSNDWTNIIFTRNGNVTNEYVDGQLVGNFTNTTYSPAHNCNLFIGSNHLDHNGNPYAVFDGMLDDIAIWNRALSASEISALYNASSNTSISTKSKYFFITNPFTAPVKLSRIQGLNSSNVDPYFYYWKQRRNTVTNNFSPAEWQAERIFNGTALRDSNIAIPAFGTILVRLKNSSTTFTIPESAKQLTNFSYIIGGAKGVSKTGLMFADATGSDIGSNGIEIKLLVNDSQESDRVLVYNEPLQSASFTTADARKYLNQDFPNIFTLSSDGKPLALDMQDIKAELDAGKSEVAIPLVINREFNKRFPALKWELTANTTDLDAYLHNRDNGTTELWTVGDIKSVNFPSDASEIRNYDLLFKRSISSTEDLTGKTIAGKRAPIEILIYPNPVDEKLMLKVLNNNGEIPFYVYSITGVKVIEGFIKSEKIINTAALNAGVYFVDAGGVKVEFIKQ
jgi:hypothetical protein